MGVTSSLFRPLFGEKDVCFLMVGLDAAGKTTILYKLKLDSIVTTIPDYDFTLQTLDYKNFKLTVWDAAGDENYKLHPLKRTHFHNTQGLIYVVDCNDRDRIQKAFEELNRILSEDNAKDATVLVFANKQDLPNAMSVADLTQELELPNRSGLKWFVQPCCAIKGTGLYEGLQWLTENLAE